MDLGKFSFTILFLLFNFVIPAISSSPSTLKGGLVYSEVVEQGPIYLNPQRYTVMRDVDTSPLENFSRFTNSIKELYQRQCTTTEKNYQEMKKQVETEKEAIKNFKPEKNYFFSKTPLPMHQHEWWCGIKNGLLPELRDAEEREELRQIAVRNGIDRIAAGIRLNTNTRQWVYMSDKREVKTASAYTKIQYGGSYGPHTYHFGSFTDDIIINMGNDYMMIYNAPEEAFALRLSDRPSTDVDRQAICQHKIQKPEMNSTNKDKYGMAAIVNHNCNRDKTSLFTAATIAVKNAMAIANFEIDDKTASIEETVEYLPKFEAFQDAVSRKKRENNPSTYSEATVNKTISELVRKIVKGTNKRHSRQIEAQLDPILSIFGALSPSLPLAAWITNILHSVTLSDIEREIRTPGSSLGHMTATKIKCFANKSCMMKRAAPQNAFSKRILLRHVKKLLVDRLVQLLESKKKIKKRNAEISNRFTKSGNLPLTSNEEDISEDNLSRPERAIPLIPILGSIAAATGAVNVGSSMVTGGAPLSWFGKPLGKLFGFANEDDIAGLRNTLLNQAVKLSALQMNGEETRQVVNDIIKAQKLFEARIMEAFQAASAVMLEVDLKSFLRYLISQIQIASNKYVMLGLSASTGKASHLAISQDELARIADNALKTKDIKLSTDINTVKMSMLKIDSTLKLVFEIPILVEENLYHFYRVDAVPLFENGTTYLPELDAQFLGISKSGSSYVTLTADEFTRCTTDPTLCTVSSPINPMTSKAHCTVTTYVTGNMTCALVESDKPAVRYIHIKGNLTIFSVPEETSVYMKCDDPIHKHKSHEATFTLVNMGQISFRPGCTVNFPDGTKFQTPAYYPTEHMENSMIFEIIDMFTIPKNARIKRFYNYKYSEPEKKEEEEYKLPTLKQLKDDILHPTKALGFLVKFVVMAILIGIVVITCLCYWAPIRVCLGKSKIFVCFEKIAPEDVEDPLQREKLKGILKSSLVKAKSTSDLFLDNIKHRRRFLTRSRSAVSFDDIDKVKEFDAGADDKYVTLHRDRVKYVYNKRTGEAVEDDSSTPFLEEKRKENS